jgi:hypothetical protein
MAAADALIYMARDLHGTEESPGHKTLADGLKRWLRHTGREDYIPAGHARRYQGEK